MKRYLVVLLALAGICTILAVAPAQAQPIEPPDPPDPPVPTGSPYDQRWATLLADPGFQAVMAAAGDAQDQTSVDALRNLLSSVPLTGPMAAGRQSTQVEGARQQVLDLLVMSPTAPSPQVAGEMTAAMAMGELTAQDPVFCTEAFPNVAVHPELPRPYGEFTPNPANNFCMPNGPYGNNLCTSVPDRGLGVFDFRRACYQHDMGYTWTPFADRKVLDLQFLLDMTTDCTTAHPWYSVRRYACYLVGGLYYLGVRAFAGPTYYENRVPIPGYGRLRAAGEPLPVFPPFVLPGQNSTCLQSSHVWVHGVSSTTVQGATLYPTGVVAAATRVVFDFVNPDTGQIVRRHITNPSRLNCVVHHEPEALSTWGLPLGRYDVYAKYTRWEAREDVRVLINTFTLVGGGGGGGGGSGGCLEGPELAGPEVSLLELPEPCLS